MATIGGMEHPILEATVYYRDSTREVDKYLNVEYVVNTEDIVWYIAFVDGGGVALAFCEVLKIEQTVQGGKQVFKANDG